MPNIPQITAPVSNSKSYSFTNRQYDGNIEPFDMVELAQPIKASTAQDNDSAAAMMMGRKKTPQAAVIGEYDLVKGLSAFLRSVGIDVKYKL